MKKNSKICEFTSHIEKFIVIKGTVQFFIQADVPHRNVSLDTAFKTSKRRSGVGQKTQCAITFELELIVQVSFRSMVCDVIMVFYPFSPSVVALYEFGITYSTKHNLLEYTAWL